MLLRAKLKEPSGVNFEGPNQFDRRHRGHRFYDWLFACICAHPA